LEAVFVLLEFSSPSRRIFIGSHSLPPSLVRRIGPSRFIYWPDRKPADLTDGNSRCVAYLDSLPFQEGTPLAPTEEHTPTEVANTDSGLDTPDRQVFMAAGETLGPSGTRPDRYFDDISADELSANAPADETNDDKNA
jgi:hypothetical protein